MTFKTYILNEYYAVWTAYDKDTFVIESKQKPRLFLHVDPAVSPACSYLE